MAQVNHVIVSRAPSAPQSEVKIPVSRRELFHVGVLGNLPLMVSEAFDLRLDSLR